MTTKNDTAEDGTVIEHGELYTLDQLPENKMNHSGNLEWVNDDTLALATDGMVYEFEMAVKCVRVAETGENGEMNVIEEVPADA